MTTCTRWMMALIIVCLAAELYGQLPLRYRLDGGSLNERYGASMGAIGDVNGDGYSDFVVGAANADVTAMESGSAFVYSGIDGSILYTFHGSYDFESVGTAVSGAGDVDADGTPDFVLASPGGNNYMGEARVISGADGSTIHSLTAAPMGLIGRSVAGAGDVNADGFDDIIVGGAGAAVVFSGADGSIMYVFGGTEPFDDFGRVVDGVGDVNADGFDDLIVSAPQYNGGTGFNNAGWIRVYSGATGLPLITIPGLLFSRFGTSVSGVNDINGDGHDDFAVGAPGTGFVAGAVGVFSGADGSVLFGIQGALPRFGIAVSGAGDADGDGTPDVAVGDNSSPNPNSVDGKVHIFSGADASVLLTHSGVLAVGLGSSLSAAGDVNGDGFDDLLAGANAADFGGMNSGSVYVLSAGGVQRYGEGLRAAQTLDLEWSPGAGADPALGTICCTGAPPNAPGIYGLSLEASNATISGVPVVIDPDPTRLLLSVPITFDATGAFSAPAGIRHPVVSGITLFAQFFSLGSTIASSNGMEFRLVK